MSTPSLNAEQHAAVRTRHPRALVLASPGSGKTRSLVERIAYLVHQGVNPSRIVAISFTNNAADEIRNRLSKLLPEQAPKLGYIGTLHGYCLRLLGRYGDAIGFRHNLTVIDEDLAAELLEAALKAVGYKISTKELEGARRVLGPRPTPDEMHHVGEKAALVIARYYQQLKRGNAIDYDGLLVEALALLQKTAGHPDQFPRIEHLLVDEYQDSTNLDHRIYEALLPDNFWIVGDPDQAIFSFRGGNMKLILALAENPAWEKHFFTANYRSDAIICEAANRLIECNRERVSKKMINSSRYDGTLFPTAYRDEDDEMQGLFGQIENFSTSGTRYEDMAILVRSNALVRKYRDGAKARRVPYAQEVNPEQDIPGWKFARVSVDMLAAAGSDFVFRNWLMLKEGAKSVEHFAQQAGMLRQSMASTYFSDVGGGIPQPPTLSELPSRLLTLGVTQVAVRALDLLLPTLPAGSALPEVSLAMRTATSTAVQSDKAGGGVAILTIHAAKGREWLTVFMPAMEEGILPNARSLREGGLEEERRLAFVGLTRAAQLFFPSWAIQRAPAFGRRVFEPAMASRFVTELIGNYPLR